jgi:hypothetical protein
MFEPRPTGPAPGVGGDGRPVTVSRHQRRRGGNSIVSEIHNWARSLVGPFDGMFSIHNAQVAIAVNWGIAAVVYACVGGLIAGLLGRAHR